MAVVRAPPRRAVARASRLASATAQSRAAIEAAEPSTPTTTTSDPVRGAGGAAIDMAFSGRGRNLPVEHVGSSGGRAGSPTFARDRSNGTGQRPHTRTSGDRSGLPGRFPLSPLRKAAWHLPWRGPQSAPRARSRGSRDQAPRSSRRFRTLRSGTCRPWGFIQMPSVEEFGAALLAAGLAMVDSDQLACHLHTSDPAGRRTTA